MKHSLLIILLILSLCQQQLILENIQILKSERVVSVEKYLVIVKTKLTVINKDQQQTNNFLITIPQKLEENLTNLEVRINDQNLNQLVKRVDQNQYKDHIVYQIDLKLKQNEQQVIQIKEEYYRRFKSHPKTISHSESQLLILYDNVYFCTLYEVDEQVSIYKIRGMINQQVEKNDKIIVVKRQTNELEVKIDKKSNGIMQGEVKIHFSHDQALAVFTNVSVEIEVSHWGTIQVREFYSLKNEGSGLKGEYNRVDYNPQHFHNARSAIRGLQAELPYLANSLYIRDEVGNISTSNAIKDHHNKKVRLTFIPRFMLIGQWKANFEIGYNLPLENYLQNSNKYFKLTQRFGFMFQDIIAKEYQLKIILPEGAKNIDTQLSVDTDSKKMDETFSYLDIQGRPTIMITKQKVSQHHKSNFNVFYEFEEYSILREPLMIFSAIMTFFMSLIILSRIELQSLKIKRE